jgi:hypothetical protein
MGLMSAQLIGGLFGLGLGVVDLVLFRSISAKPDFPERNRKMLENLGYAQVVFFPIIGWFVGPMVLGE